MSITNQGSSKLLILLLQSKFSLNFFNILTYFSHYFSRLSKKESVISSRIKPVSGDEVPYFNPYSRSGNTATNESHCQVSALESLNMDQMFKKRVFTSQNQEVNLPKINFIEPKEGDEYLATYR